EQNHLVIYFKSPLTVNADKLRGTPYHKTAENDALKDEKVSVYARKAPYHFGWDWGPRIVTSGIWRPVKLVEWDNIILDEIQIYQKSLSEEQAILQANVITRGNFDANYTILLKNATNNEILAQQNITNPFSGNVIIDFTINNPQLWWTHNLGEPYLYNFIIEISTDGQVVDSKSIRYGLRNIALVREKDKFGESFYFKLNGIPVFMKGANYIPSETMLPRRSTADLDRILNDAKAVNMNMIRVWGGGIYEDDYFYDKCDEMGLLVWQDFMFACSMYPGVDTAFYENVKQEAIENVRRLRNHPSIAIWCGNNEVDIAWHNWGWQVRFLIIGKEAQEMKESYQKLFHELLPDIIKNEDPQRPYVHSSPLSEGGKSGNLDNGCMHYWKPWNMNDEFDGYEKNVGRYMNEYGFQSFPEMATIKQFSTSDDWSFDSEVMKKHQKSYIGNGRIGKFVDKYYAKPTDFEDFAYKSQLVQAEGIRTAIRAHRKAMPRCMGTVYWQLDDCWPAPSWSSIDYYGRWKALHYALKELYADQLIVPWEANGFLHIQIINDQLDTLSTRVFIESKTLNGKELYRIEKNVILSANTSEIYAVIPVESLLQNMKKEEVVLSIHLGRGDSMIAKTNHYFVLPKDLDLKTPKNLEIQINESAKTLTLRANTLIKGLYLFTENDIRFENNYFDLLPNEAVTIAYQGELKRDHLQWKYYQKNQ
ncbi:MAG: glycoside hydrolase family 2 protein, partial [Saprospiraceae bacterium]|nr:glycoside hydrolase family 2 protein [Saprospiraceae bacterium]